VPTCRLPKARSSTPGVYGFSTVTVSDLYTWAYKQDDPTPILDKVLDFLRDVRVLALDEVCARDLGKLRGTLLRQGIRVSPVDWMIGVIARVHDLTLVTHNTADFRNIPGLRLEDWLVP
jgi:tRNA(fMet)-specific endonuclease VapC